MKPTSHENDLWFIPKDDDEEWCRCVPTTMFRSLEEELAGGTTQKADSSTWEIVYTCLVLAGMFAFLITDRLGADTIMLAALTAFLAARIISVPEGLQGFANPGLLTVLVLFVVAEGISKTGALDWYMGKLLGRPRSNSVAQLKLMVPIAVVSAFLNNTPVVVVMIPIILRWAKNNRLAAKQLLIPLSFASILGGTCTLIGTSTNLVVVGLLEERYGDEISIGLFDLGEYGVPVALAGIAYILLFSPCLIDSTVDTDDTSDILLGARLTPWSPAAGRTVGRSGLRDTGGIFLVSVHRAATGNVHRAVSADFVLQPGDLLYFTGFIESFGEFCVEHGLQVLTNEEPTERCEADVPTTTAQEAPKLIGESHLAVVEEDEHLFLEDGIPVEVGTTKESLLQADGVERLRNINRMTDLIRGVAGIPAPTPDRAPKIVVTTDKDLLVVGVNARDRSGLLLDISKTLLRFQIQLRHTEAAVVGDRSVSIWRCEPQGTEIPDIEEIWSVLSALLSDQGGVRKERGLRVVRARVSKGSRLVGKLAKDVNFRQDYGAALIAPNRSDPRPFATGDQVVLQVGENSPLLESPSDDENPETNSLSRTNSVGSFVMKLIRKGSEELPANSSSDNLTSEKYEQQKRETLGNNTSGSDEDFFIPDGDEDDARPNEPSILNLDEFQSEEWKKAAWNDLVVVKGNKVNGEGTVAREFLTAMAVAPQSQLAGKSAANVGLNKLPDLFLVSIDRPKAQDDTKKSLTVLASVNQDGSSVEGGSSFLGSVKTDNRIFDAIDQEEPLKGGDVLWFSGPAYAVGDLRKIPGLVSYENDEVEKINGKVLDRRLVQAVVARKGPLVGKTIKQVRFRTKYGAAVIAVHREGNRVHEHPGNIKLQAGDVLLLEAGPSFLAKTTEHDRSFALLAEIADSAPPRLQLLIPALLIAAAMLGVFMAEITTLLVSALVASGLMIFLGILSEQEARDAINWEVYLTIASAFGIGTALVNSGVADAIANFLVDVGTRINLGDSGLLGAVYLATFLISNVVTNNAAAALLFPIAMNAAEQTGVDLRLMSYSLMLGASASFMTPFGYTTNLLIYGPGGYKYKDFLKFGTPMQLVLLVLSTLFLSIGQSWLLSWGATATFLMLVLVARLWCSKSLQKV